MIITTNNQDRADALRALTVESDPSRFLELSATWVGFLDLRADAAAVAARFDGVDNHQRDQACADLGMRLRRAYGL
jgi:hypothetical protein